MVLLIITVDASSARDVAVSTELQDATESIQNISVAEEAVQSQGTKQNNGHSSRPITRYKTI